MNTFKNQSSIDAKVRLVGFYIISFMVESCKIKEITAINLTLLRYNYTGEFWKLLEGQKLRRRSEVVNILKACKLKFIGHIM